MTTPRQEVERRQDQPPAPTPQSVIRQTLDEYRPVIARLLTGTGIGEEAFIAQIANACRAVPQLWTCEPRTVLGAALKAAQLGLAPNDARNLCWILPYRVDGVQTAQWQLGYGGVMELARRAVPGLRFDGRPVYPNDEFDVDYGRAEPLTHRPAVVLRQDRGGDAYAWYVRAVYPDGAVQIHVLDKDGVEYHRRYSKQPNGQMWTKSYDAAALKSVVLDMRRWLPSSAQLTAALGADERVHDVARAEEDSVDVGEVNYAEPHEEPPAEEAP